MHPVTAPTPEQVFARVASEPGAMWLDGADGSGWSVLTWRPTQVCVDLGSWRRFLTEHTPHTAPVDVPFAGGVLGYLGYGVGHTVEQVPTEAATPEPPVFLGAFEGGLCFHHPTGRWHAQGTAAFRLRADELLDGATVLAHPGPASGRARTIHPDVYAQRVRRILAFIAEGDCYQVNLSRVVDVDGAGDPFSAYRRLRARSPARFGAFLRLDADTAILSNSPEMLVRTESGMALAEPIKGTRSRGTDPEADRILAQELVVSGKEKAELTMIVDLLRNDLGRVAVPGSVVAGRRQIRHHATVHHASQAIRAELAEGRSATDVLAALLPYGSITGAPKIRACQRIAELETRPRGAYCGAIGFASGGDVQRWSVAIRTAIFSGKSARYHVGGGIVAESEPAAEWVETVAKGAALAAALHIDEARLDADADNFWSI